MPLLHERIYFCEKNKNIYENYIKLHLFNVMIKNINCTIFINFYYISDYSDIT